MNQNVRNCLPVLAVRWGFPTENEGGPLNIVAKLLSSFGKMDMFEQFGFVSANCSLAIQKGKKYITNLPQVQSKTIKDRYKQILSKIAYTSTFGHSLALDRDCRRLEKRMVGFPFKPNIIHSHNIIYSGMMFPIHQAKSITTIHYKGSLIEDGLGLKYPYIKGRRLEKRYIELETAGILSSDVITFPSHEAKRMFEHSHPKLLDTKRVEIVYNGINIEEFPVRKQNKEQAIEKKEFVILNIAAMIPQKRFDIVLDVVVELIRRGMNVKLIHIGSGPLYEHFLTNVRKMGLERYVEMYEFLPHSEIIKHFYSSMIHFLPSENVVFDLITLEAMAAGLPSVVTNDGGNKELVKDGVDSILVEKGDVKGFVNSIQKLVKDKPLWSAISKNGRIKIEKKYSQEKMVTEYIKLYESLCK